jgi:hypothetical protein
MPDRFQKLENLISQVPTLCSNVATGTHENGFWWVKFSLDINNPLAWNVVQVFAYVINYLSISERLSTVFYPVSPPPYTEGGPDKCLSWIIESTSQDFMPNELAEWLEVRLPDPTNLDEWKFPVSES